MDQKNATQPPSFLAAVGKQGPSLLNHMEGSF